MPDARLHLNFVFAGPGEPLLDDFVQTFYAVDVIWAEATESISRRVRSHTSEERFREERSRWVDADPPALWVPVPSSLPEEFRLRVEAVTMASPLDLLLHVPLAALLAAGPVVVHRLIAGLEKSWNAPRRIRLEGVRIERDYWRALAERDEARRDYELRAPRIGPPRPNFELESGTLEIPEEWAGQEDEDAPG